MSKLDEIKKYGNVLWIFKSHKASCRITIITDIITIQSTLVHHQSHRVQVIVHRVCQQTLGGHSAGTRQTLVGQHSVDTQQHSVGSGGVYPDIMTTGILTLGHSMYPRINVPILQ